MNIENVTLKTEYGKLKLDIDIDNEGKKVKYTIPLNIELLSFVKSVAQVVRPIQFPLSHYNPDRKTYVKNERIDRFLEEIIDVCKRHDLTLSHENKEGAFEIENFDHQTIEWLKAAFDKTDIPKRRYE